MKLTLGKCGVVARREYLRHSCFMSDRLTRALALIDDANAKDPAGQAVAYGRRMSETLDRFAPDAPESLKVAARAQHIERWTVPRTSYPEGRIAYLTWRKDLQKLHTRRAGEIMSACGYSEGEIARTASLLKKERLKQDPDAQTLEDVICLVFLRHEAEPFIAKHDDDKVRDILAKTVKKMSPRGLAAAAQVPMGGRLKRLLGEALATG